MLDVNIKNSISDLDIGQISLPIKTETGYHIILLNNKRKTKKIKKDQTIYDLSQILFKLKKSYNNKKQENYYKELFI